MHFTAFLPMKKVTITILILFEQDERAWQLLLCDAYVYTNRQPSIDHRYNHRPAKNSIRDYKRRVYTVQDYLSQVSFIILKFDLCVK